MAKKERGFQRRVGTLVRSLRKELRWSKAELGQRAGRNERTVSNVECCNSVEEETAVAITDALNKGVKERHSKDQWDLPYGVCATHNLFEFDDRGRCKARGAAQMPDDRRKELRAFLKGLANGQ